MSRSAWLLLLGLGCSQPAVPSPAPTAPPAGAPAAPRGCAAQPGGCSNVIDQVVVELLGRMDRSPSRESDEVLCRRLSLDLNGVPPSAAEVDAACRGKSPREMVRHFMDKPSADHLPPGAGAPYVYVSRRGWAADFQYLVSTAHPRTTTFYRDVDQLDRLVIRLYSGDITYTGFAVEALAAPAFLRRFGQPDASQPADPARIAAAAFRLFLGREATGNEAQDLGNLWRPYTLTLLSDAAARALYPDCGPACSHYAVAVQGGTCSGAGALLCQSTVLGPAQVRHSVPAGRSARVQELPADDQQSLRAAGRLIINRPEFAEAAADRVLQRYLGWWNSGFFRPDYNLPAVREALGRFFIAHDYLIRDLEEEVLTSVLYTQATRLGAGELVESPLWAYGPLKPMNAEVFLDSLQLVSGARLGGCDPRFGFFRNDQNGLVADNRVPSTYQFPRDPAYSVFAYTLLADKMGGCPNGTISNDRGEGSGLVPTLAKREALATLCRDPRARARLVPADPPPTDARQLPQALLAHQFTLALGRAPRPEELQAAEPLLGGVCPEGRCDPAQLAPPLCEALLGSALFSYY